MPIASNSDNIRFNGTGRLYVATVGASGVGMEIGEIDGLSDSMETTTDKIKSNRTAARATLKEVETERTMSLSFGMREQSIENLQLALAADTPNVTSQTAGTIDGVALTMTAKEYNDLGKVNCFITKIGHGTVTGGPFVIGTTVTGGDSNATGDIAWVGSGYLELVNVSGTFVSGETLTATTVSATSSSVETLADVVLCDAASPTTRYTLGTDYRVDSDYGFIMKMPSPGTIGATAYVWCDYLAASKSTMHALSAASTEKKLTFVTDADDLGPQMRFTYHKVKLTLNGDRQLIGDGESILPMTGTVLADSTKPTGQQYMQTEVFE
jgi:hypothetical protein